MNIENLLNINKLNQKTDGMQSNVDVSNVSEKFSFDDVLNLLSNPALSDSVKEEVKTLVSKNDEKALLSLMEQVKKMESSKTELVATSEMEELPPSLKTKELQPKKNNEEILDLLKNKTSENDQKATLKKIEVKNLDQDKNQNQNQNDLSNLKNIFSKTKELLHKSAGNNVYNVSSEKSLFTTTEDEPKTLKIDSKINLEQGRENLLTNLSLDSRGQQSFGSNQDLKMNPVFNLDNLGSSDIEAVIDKVQNYIVQSKASGQSKVEISFDHQDLGKVDLLVEKATKDALNIQIRTNSHEGSQFFKINQGDLLKSLAQSGVQVAHLKLENSSGSQFNNNSNFSQNGSEGNYHQGSASHRGNEGQHDSERRQELWRLASERMAA